MKHLLGKITAMVVAAPLAVNLMASAAQADTIRIALAETPSDELAAFFVALDRARANGLDYEWTAFSDEELAIQTVLSGQMDIGFGTPYSPMQRSKAPIRTVPLASCRRCYWTSLTDFMPMRSRAGLMIPMAAVATPRWRIWSGTLPPDSSTATPLA